MILQDDARELEDQELLNPIVLWWIAFGAFAVCTCVCHIKSDNRPRPTVRTTGRPAGNWPRRIRRPLSNTAATASATAAATATTNANANANANASTTVVPPRLISVEHDRVQENTHNLNHNNSTPENHCNREQLILNNFEFRTIAIAIPSPPSNSKAAQLFRNLLFQQDERLQAVASSSPLEQGDLEIGGITAVPDNKDGEDHDNDNDDDSEIGIRGSPNNEDKTNHSWLFSNSSDHCSSTESSSFRSFFFQGSSVKSRSTPTECCSICLENYAVGDVVARLKRPNRKDDNRVDGVRCKHWFHKDCISEWLQNHRECPLCRVDMI